MILANTNRDKKKRAKPFELSEFMPVRPGRGKAGSGKRKKQSWEEQLLIAKEITLAFGGQMPGDGKASGKEKG